MKTLLAAIAILAGCRTAGAPSAGNLASTDAVWSVAVLGDSTDSRFVAVTEAVAHWNALFDTLDVRMRFAPARASPERLSDKLLQQMSASVRSRRVARPRELDAIPGDVVIALANVDMISFGYSPQRLGRGFIGLRSAHGPPLSLPNVARNIAAHELGHVLGLPHNQLPGTLMCSGPEACLPRAFRSDTAVFFPITHAERRLLRDRLP